MNKSSLIYLCSQAKEDGHKELADRAERMAELLARCTSELVALGSDPDEAGSVLKAAQDELGYT